MEFAYREYGGWANPGIEVEVRDDRIFIGDRLPMRLEPAEATGLIALVQHVLDAEHEFIRYPSQIADAGFRELEIQIGPGGGSRCFTVRDLDAAPPAFEALARELTSVWRAVWRADHGTTSR